MNERSDHIGIYFVEFFHPAQNFAHFGYHLFGLGFIELQTSQVSNVCEGLFVYLHSQLLVKDAEQSRSIRRQGMPCLYNYQ
jgi:hypothetical protein